MDHRPDPRRLDRAHYEGFWICGECVGLFGTTHPEGLPQRCRCRGRAEEPVWPGFDFNERAHLCECCVAEVLRSGSRFSVWFCEECRVRVIELNRSVGACLVPIGRHTLMAGVGLSGPDAVRAKEGDPAARRQRDEFIAASMGLFARMDHLDDFSRTRLRQNLRALGLSGDVLLTTYLEAVAVARLTDPSFTKEAAFGALVEHFQGTHD